MYNVIIIDDEPLARSIVKECLQQHPQFKIAEECGNGFEGVKAIQQHNPDLIFLDVQMPKITGFEMLELLDQPPYIIFTTAFDEYAMQAFEANAVDYLLKPFSQERFDKAINKWMDMKSKSQQQLPQQLLQQAGKHPSHNERIVVKTGSRIKIIPLHEVHYLEAADDYVKIVTQEGSFLKKNTMGYYEDLLTPSQFIRTHRSYIINVQEITRIDPYEKENHIAILRSGAKVPVSRTGYPKLKALLGL
ncbi:MAG: LytTR family transcriptional regulator DNA-binding domain-containing protein [Chitinophagaceae bacterium]|nr:LytTR family transcriptional regulator DNA-binding domain-containing protein [Chitinophagaceae bacterium]